MLLSFWILRSFVQESDITNRELKELQQRNNELQHQVDSLRSECEEMEEKHVIQTQKLREEMRALHNKHKQEAATIEASHKVSLYAVVTLDMPINNSIVTNDTT